MTAAGEKLYTEEPALSDAPPLRIHFWRWIIAAIFVGLTIGTMLKDV